MKNVFLALVFTIGMVACYNSNANINDTKPIRLHPDNQHYFLYKGKPLALISSAEHYGALINLDFDYRTYLETLSAEGMNYTRIFTGTYFEDGGEFFNIQQNTLGPARNKTTTPWLIISDTTNEARYNLDVWNEAYFSRLRSFMELAATHDIIVEITLFSSFYSNQQWDINPFNPINNNNLENNISYLNAQTLKDTALFNYQELYVRKMVRELNRFDNFFFEIQNEPWFDHLDSLAKTVDDEKPGIEDSTLVVSLANKESLQWQKQIALIITNEEKTLAKQHLIAQNYADCKEYKREQVNSSPLQKDKAPFIKVQIPEVDDNISILNFHYAGFETVEGSYDHNRVIGFDETGFSGSEDIVYRRQAWRFMLSGGGLFNNLDYSFYAGHEDGLGKYKAPGGGSKALRQQLRILSDFLHSFDLVQLYPNNSCIVNSPKLTPYILSGRNTSFAIFVEAISSKSSKLEIKADNGYYQGQILNTITGEYSQPFAIEAVGGVLLINIEMPDGELALKITKK